MTPYKGRKVRPGDRVKVRWNRRTGAWSILAANGPMWDRVVAHADELHLADVEFRVSQVQRQRAQELASATPMRSPWAPLLDPGADPRTNAQETSATRATYRYQRYGTFVTANYEDAVYHAAYADFGPDGQMFVRSG